MVAHRVMSEMPALDSLPDKLRKLLAKALYVRLTVRWGGASSPPGGRLRPRIRRPPRRRTETRQPGRRARDQAARAARPATHVAAASATRRPSASAVAMSLAVTPSVP